MRIKTRIQLGIILSFVLAGTVGLLLFLAARTVNEANRLEGIAAETVKGVAELKIITHEYLLHPEERSLMQWRSKYGSLSKLLTGGHFKSPDEKTLADQIFKNLERFKTVFFDLTTGLRKGEALDQQESSAFRELRDRMIGELLVQSQLAVSLAFQLHQDIDAKSVTTQKRVFLLTVLFLLALTATIIGISLWVNRSIARPIAKLEKDIKIIGSGDLDHKVGTTAKDEIGQFSRAFDKMTQDLKETTTSIVELNKEIDERKRAEEALRESETRFRAQYQGNPTATFTWQKSGEGFVLANFNNAAEAITHGRAHEYLGKTATELYGNRQEVQEVLHRCLAEKIVIRKEMVSHDFLPGRYIMTNYAFVPPDLVMVHVTDITERKHTEETMRKSEEKYRSLVESTEDSIYLLDKDGTYLFMNEKHLSRLGLPADKVIGKTYGEFHPLGDTKEFLEKIEKIFETGQTTQHEHRSFRDDRYFLRTLSPVKDPGGNTTSVTVVSKDITDRARSEEALKESEEKYRTVLEANPDPLVVYGMEGRVIYLNPAFTRVFHWSLEELIGKKMDNFVPEENWPETRMMISKVTVSGEDFSGFETRRYTRDGNTLDVSISGSFYRDREGNVAASVINLRDITEQKKMATQLQQSQKMEAVGTLAGGIAHDFNNILAVILGNAELAIDDVPKGNLAAECLEEIRLASIRAKEMIQQLLSFSRKTDEENKPLNMVPVIKASMKMLRTAIPSSVEFNQHISDEPCNIMGNASQINQIVMNLVTNAFHAMYEEEGLLEVTLEKIILQEEKPCFDWILAPGAYVRLKARDTGKGIDQQILGRIFEPYYTTKDVGKGTGMGLSVVHGIVKRHDGGIRVESEFGKGTVFEIYFPALVEMIEEEKELDGEIKGGSERILFVDDEASIVKLNHQRLESLGYRVKSTTRPLEALEWFRADPDQFDVIITDMTMPKMVGDKLTKEILAIRPDMPVIICTGYSERISADNAEALGARKYIEKPIEIRELAASLREVLEEK